LFLWSVGWSKSVPRKMTCQMLSLAPESIVELAGS
jgi:hypothetical protein